MSPRSENSVRVAPLDSARLQALDEYAVFDTPPDVDLDRLVELAARMYGTPVAALSLVGRDRLFFKSRFGMEATGIGRTGSFCAYAIENNDLFLVPDATKDERFASHPLVTDDPKIRFYAGIPLIVPSGHKIGTLCILDVKPWAEFSEDDRKNLEDVADLVMNRLELRRLEQAKAGGHMRFERLASASPDAIFSADSAGIINYWNNAATSLFGYSASEAIGKPIGLLFPAHVRNLQIAEIMSLVNAGTKSHSALQLALRAQRSDGSEFPAEISVSIWQDDEGMSFAAILRDVTDSEQGEQRLFALAHLDALTGLPNRSYLIDRLLEATTAEAGTLLLVDLHGFRDINDSLGHSIGDLLLSETAERLRHRLGRAALIARLGADEFAVLLPGCTDRGHAAAQADEIRQALQPPYALEGEAVHVGVHIGIAICPAHGTGAEELLSNANLALQRAKTSIGSAHQFYTPNLRRAATMRRSLEAELRQALCQSQFELFYQPQIRMSDRSIVGAEALLRWNHPQRGLLAPGEFISVLESSHLAADVGEWVLDTACAQGAVWRRMGRDDFRIGVNLFEAQFNGDRLVTRVENTLIKNNLPAQALELEITENIMLRHDESIIVPLREMCAWGAGIAFDDYGTGFASLSLLKRYPVTRLKIDRTFVRNLCTDKEDAAIVQAIVYLGRNFDLGIIAEGVETDAQEQALKMYGCTEAQGYLYSRPVPAEALTQLILPREQDAERTVA